MKKLMGFKLDMMEMERVAGGVVGPVCSRSHNETGPLGTGPLVPDSCDPPFKTGPLGTGPLKETGPIGYPY